MIHAGDTIVAIATAPGRGAVGLVRLSGPGAHSIGARCLDRWPAEARRAVLSAVRDPVTGTVVDRGIVVRYDAPHSYTGEDVVEFSGHGGLLSPTAVAALAIREGARQAEPGEFTRRAVLNGKLDLLQAEGIAAIVDARTEASRRAALRHVDGGLSRQIGMLRDSVIDVEALLAYEIDFPEEDDGPIAPQRIESALSEVLRQLRVLKRGVHVGEIVREGAVVVLAGPPNAGKSSLFNALLGIERAIVHHAPGTTRDAIEAVVEGRRWPLRLVDTAGLRDSNDEVERTGVEVSQRYLGGAHVVLVCGPDRAALDSAGAWVRSVSTVPVIEVMTKSDVDGDNHAEGALSVSAHLRSGLPELLDVVEATLDATYGSLDPEQPVLTRARHQSALADAERELAAFGELWRSGAVPATIASVHLRAAVHALETLVGAVNVDDVLSRVFSTFCVGK